MSVQGPTADTYGLFCPLMGQRINLRALPIGAPAEANPDNMLQLPSDPLYGPAGEPLSQPAHAYAESTIALDLEEVPAWQFEDYADFVDDLRGRPVRWSPAGETTYQADSWTLLSTTDGWTETRHGIWAGPLLLVRRGTA